MKKNETHAAGAGGAGYTLCGNAAEGTCGDGEEADDAPAFAKSGERVTCPRCRAIIDHCKQFKGYKQPADQLTGHTR